MHIKKFFEGTSVIVGAALGAGIFTLPYVFYEAGWATSLFYIFVLAACIVFAHYLYWQTLESVGKKERLLGLARQFLGKIGFSVGFAAILLGLLFTLVVYLILGGNFLSTIVPGCSPGIALFLFWGIAMLPMFLREKRLALFDALAVSAIFFIVLVIASQGISAGNKAFDPKQLWFPFAPILFSLAGWTSIATLYGAKRRLGIGSRWELLQLASGTLFVVFLYLLFSFGIIHSAPVITADTISGLGSHAEQILVALLGVFALCTSYAAISLEIERTLEDDLKVRKVISKIFVFAAPFLIAVLGFGSLFAIVGLVGGLFLSLQYLLILRVADRALRLEGLKKFFLELVSTLFIIAAVYELYRFIVR